MAGQVGVGASGVISDLVAKGALDVFLTKGATTTFWKSSYQKHTNFSMETVYQALDTGIPSWDNTRTCTVQLNRTGDLLYYLYAHIELPSIRLAEEGSTSGSWALIRDNNLYQDPKTVPEPDPMCQCTDGSSVSVAHHGDQVEEELATSNWAHWANAVGQLIFDRIDLKIGGQTVDSVWGDYMYCFEETSGRVGRRLLEMVGKRYTRLELLAASQCKQDLYVPIPFWFTQASGLALPLSSLQFHSVRLEMHTKKLQDLVVFHAADGRATPRLATCDGKDLAVNISVMGTFVYLDNKERDMFASSNYEILMQQHQRQTKDTGVLVSTGTPSAQMLQLQFNHPVIEIMWYIRRKAYSAKAGLFNFTGVKGKDPLASAHMYLNGQSRFGGSQFPGNYYRLVQPYQAHSCIPDSFVYVYSFALFPEDSCAPSGSINMSRIDNIQLSIEIQQEMYDAQGCEIVVFATNWQLGRLRDGLFGVAYAS